jgi:hypothetical protein
MAPNLGVLKPLAGRGSLFHGKTEVAYTQGVDIMKRILLVIGLLAIVTLMAAAAMAAPKGENAGKGIGANLTEEQRTQLFAKMDQMKAAGAKPEEIRAAVAEMFKGWGLEVPQREPGQGNGLGLGKIMEKLTPEQKTQLQAKIKEMRKAGAKPEEIRAAVAEMLKGWGIEMPKAGEGQGGLGKGLMDKLTDEQKTQLQAKIKQMREANAKPEEIKAAVAEMLKGWGIEMPQREGAGLGKGIMDKLTDEQKTQLQAKIKQMREANAKPEEIKAAVAEMLKGWGIEMPAAGEGQGQGMRNGFGANLTEEQRTQLQAKIKEMRQAGAKPEEIRAAVAELFKGWGIEMPKRGEGAGGGLGKGLMDKLTEEQKTQLQAKVKEMRAAGAKPEEIRAAVQELLKGWGVQPPQDGQGRGQWQTLLQNLTPEQRQQVQAKIKELRQQGRTPEEIKKAVEDMIKGFGDKA